MGPVKNRPALPLLLAATAGFTVWSLGSCGFRKPEIRNVLLISIDTLRADHLSSYGFARKTTPNLDALAREGTLFRNVISPVPMTLPAHGSMLTGTIPPHHGLHDNLGGRLPDSSVTLAEILKDRGFTTGAIVSSFVLDSRFNLSQGFDTYDDRFEKVHTINYLSERKGDETARLARAWLEEHRRERFFLFVHFYDPHEDYAPPEPFASRFADDRYAGEVAFADHCAGQVVERLRELGLLESTLVVITGDHGEMLGEHGELTHQFFVYQSALKVPLIFRAPGRREARQVDQLVGLVDILPTICGVLGFRVPAPVQGEDLSPWLRGESPRLRERGLFAESFAPTRYYGASPLFALVTKDRKYIEAPRPELYDLERDPGETVNLLEKERPHAEVLRSELQRIVETRTGKKESAALDEDARRRLSSLGYLGRGQGEGGFGSGGDKEDPKDLIGFYRSDQKLAELTRAGNHKEARALCEKMLRERPGFVDGYLQLAEIAVAQADPAGAVRQYSKAIELDPKAERPHFGLANILATRGELDQAVAHYQRALEIRPEFAEARVKLAAALNQQGRFGEAARTLQEARGGQLESAEASLQLGLALASQGRLDEAINHYRRALARDPSSAEAHSYLGSALGSQGHLDEAIEHFEQALRTKPDLAQVHQRLGTALKQRGRMDEAVQHLREAVRLSPGLAEAHLQLGLALKQLGKLNEAADEYRRALSVNPRLAAAHNNLGSLLGLEGRLPDAVRHFRAALQVDPDYDEAHNNLGLALRMMGERDEALKHFRAALRGRPEWPEPMNEIAWILATHPDGRVRDPREAVGLAERSAELTGFRQPVILDTLAAAYAASGDFDRAVATAQKATALAAAGHSERLAGEIGRRLELYREKTPFREAARAQAETRR